MRVKETKQPLGKYFFDDIKIKKYISKKYYKQYIKSKENGEELSPKVIKIMAKAIKKWAKKLGATHYCHWFMPLNNKTAEKQVSFLEFNNKGKIIENFSEKSLVKSEVDASSFPNDKQCSTFEARGYTIWDYTSPIFIKENAHNKVLYIPAVFCSYNGLALDEKIPLLRALEKLNKEAKRILLSLGYKNVKRVSCFVGAEQEYFLIKQKDYEQRTDLKQVQRTIFGNKIIKSQESFGHYFGKIDDEICKIMFEVDKFLWDMGISAKIQHKEVAPFQYELVPIYTYANIACDQNQIIMETLSKIAKKYGYVCLFHEKPFNCLNGSGKHINFSFSTDNGINLLDENEDKNLFYIFFSSMIIAVDRYYKLIRASCAYYNNDLRLGGKEAPTSLISVFTGGNLETFNRKGKKEKLNTRVSFLPKIVKDCCNRNRTSPFAYCGSKFEFRMVGASQNIAFPITCICTAYQQILKEIADELDKVKNNKDREIKKIVKNLLLKHEKIIFNGNSYDEQWLEEAKNRGLINYKDCLSAYKTLSDKDIIELFVSSNILTEKELLIRKNILIKNYIEDITLEANTIREILNKEIYPSIINTINFYSKNESKIAKDYLNRIVLVNEKLYKLHKKLNKLISQNQFENLEEKAMYFRDNIIPLFDKIRDTFDLVENIIPSNFKPFSSYNDIFEI